MLKEFVNRPQKRLACVIEEKGELEKLEKGVWKYTHKGKGATTTLLKFSTLKNKKDAEPQVGDYIVFLSKTDVYLCDKKTWEDAWSPSGMRIG